MTRIRYFVAVWLTVMTVGILGCAGTPAASGNAEAIDLLIGSGADADARMAAVDRLEPLTEQDKARLLAAVDFRNQNDDASSGNVGFILRALIRHADEDIVHGLGRLLVDANARYYAVALGVIGDEAAVPYLNTAIRKSGYNFVHNNCKQALRTINIRNSLDNLPRASRHTYPIKPTLKADATTLRLGERVTITATYENFSEETAAAMYTPWMNLFQAISLQGDHLARLPGPNIFYIVNEDYFKTLKPGESYRVSQTFELVVEPMLADKWWPAFENKAFDMLCLKRVEDGGGWVIARYIPGQPTTLRIASVHRPEQYRGFVEELGIKDYLWADLISPAIEIECIPEQPMMHDSNNLLKFPL